MAEQSLSAANDVSIEIVPNNLPPFRQSGARLVISFINDTDHILEQISKLRDTSKPALEPLFKEYMRTVERLIQLSGTNSGDEERHRLNANVKVLEEKRNTILEMYHVKIRDLLASQTQIRIESSVASLPLHFGIISPGSYRVHVVLTIETTQLHWFEPLKIQGGDRQTIQLTRDNINNPDWTEVNWWSFMNLDFSKHHQIP